MKNNPFIEHAQGKQKALQLEEKQCSKTPKITGVGSTAGYPTTRTQTLLRERGKHEKTHSLGIGNFQSLFTFDTTAGEGTT